jgi:hypothetical protein
MPGYGIVRRDWIGKRCGVIVSQAAVTAVILVILSAASGLRGAMIPIPNGSFESPGVPDVSPYATPNIDDWQKAAAPSWWLGYGYTAEQWYESAGIFLNVPFAPVANVDGNQVAFLFATQGVELYQDLTVSFQAGQSYHLTGWFQGGGYGMPLGTTLEMRLYYRDPTINSGDNRVSPAGWAAVVSNTNATGTLSSLSEYELDIPAVQATDPWAGLDIGVQIISTSNNGGYWDLDNIQLTSSPEPASLSLLALGVVGLVSRRRR